MEETLKKIFSPSGFVWPPFLPIIAVIVSLNCHSRTPFLLCAMISILFYGYFAFEIHNIDLPKKQQLHSFCKINEYWFNGLGSFIGWVSLYLLIFYVIRIDASSMGIALSRWTEHLGINDLVLATLAYLGLTGYLPLFSLLKGKEHVN